MKKNKNKKYNSIHQYLEEVLKEEKNPSDKRIKEVKKEYWKLWYREYHKQRRKKRKEFTLGFDQETLSHIKGKKVNLSVSKFLYSAVHHYLQGSPTSMENKQQLVQLHQESMKLINNLEEIIDTESYETLEQVIEKLEHIEQNLAKLYK